MRKLLFLLSVSFAVASAQSVETRWFRAIMRPTNEVPPVDINASGVTTIRATVVRGTNGAIVSGTVDFITDYNFPGAITFQGLHIHDGAAGINGPVRIDTGLTAANTIVSDTGQGTITRQVIVPADNANAVATLNSMFRDPSQHYANIHTPQNPGGVIRGQLQLAKQVVVIGQMKPTNENPPTSVEAEGVGTVIGLITQDAQGNITSGQVTFDVQYRFPTQVNFTGLHVHTGGPTVNGPVTLNSGLRTLTSAANGVGRVRMRAEMDVTSPAVLTALDGLFTNPGGFYINIHTTDFPGGAIRSQLRPTDTTQFTVNMLPSNEVPPVAIDASATGIVTTHTLRDDAGKVAAGFVEFQANYRFPGEVEFTGFHVHDGQAGENGPVRLDSGINAASSIRSATGVGTISESNTMMTPESIATLNSVLATPQRHYLNLHSTVNPGGVIRGQLGTIPAGAPAAGAVVSAVDTDPPATIGLGGLFAIYGDNLSATAGDLSGFAGASAPLSLNGVEVTIGGASAPLLYVSPTKIVGQVPYEVAAGNQPVMVKFNGASSTALRVAVAASAPAIFTYPDGAIAFKESDFSLVGPGNAVTANDMIWVYATGLGQTTPAATTGQVIPTGAAYTTSATVTATIGGTAATVMTAEADPGEVGVYRVRIRVPAGVAAGNRPLMLSIGTARSNAANLAVR